MFRDLKDMDLDGNAFEASHVPFVQMHKLDQAVSCKDVAGAWSLQLEASEQVADNVSRRATGQCLPKTFKGKGRCDFVTRSTQPRLVSRGRADTLQMPCEALGVQFRQRIKQIRRIDAALAQARARSIPNQQREASLRATWNAVAKSPGFHPSFPVCCVQELDILSLGCPFCAGHVMPPREVGCICSKVEKSVHVKRRSHVREMFSTNWDKGASLFFRALQGEP